MNYMTVENFSKAAVPLRKQFESVMMDDHNPRRFSWDLWNKPDRYVHLRTPAEKFFEGDCAKHLERIKEELSSFGENELGCRSLSPLWLSCYVDGCEQRWHADRPHGPWAFVLSISPTDYTFSGGETILLKPEILSYWNSPVSSGKPFEDGEVVQRVAPKFNRLTVFDPRVPHGVSTLKGTMNPIQGRLVLHGWFTQPRPFYKGPIATKIIETALAEFDQMLARDLTEFSSSGTIAFKVSIAKSGKVTEVKALASSLASGLVESSYQDQRRLATLVRHHFLTYPFPKANTKGELILPLTFQGT